MRARLWGHGVEVDFSVNLLEADSPPLGAVGTSSAFARGRLAAFLIGRDSRSLVERETFRSFLLWRLEGADLHKWTAYSARKADERNALIAGRLGVSNTKLGAHPRDP